MLLVTFLRKGLYGALTGLLQSLGAAPAPPCRVRPAAVRATAAPPAPHSAGAAVPFALEAHAVSKGYGGIRAVSQVSLAVLPGEIFALIGPNGAGKSTFLRLLSGEETPDGGHILLRGQDITGYGVTAVNQAGIAKSYQINQLFGDLTCRQNLRIAALGQHRGALHFDIFRGAGSIAAVEESVADVIEQLGLHETADVPAHMLPYGEKRRIELGLALATEPSVLLLDEPLAGLSPGERQDVIRLIRRFAAGRTIVLVEHDMDAVFALAGRIMVMHEGRPLAEGTAAEIRRDARVRRAYLGGVAAHADA